MAYGTALEKRPPVLRSAGSNPALSAIESLLGYRSSFSWRGAGVADQARLESVCTRKGTVGSNPTLSVLYRTVIEINSFRKFSGQYFS